MAKIILFSYLFFLAATSVASDFHRKIMWSDKPDSIKLEQNGKFMFNFEGSISIDQTGLPYWFESFELNLESADVVLVDAIFEPVNDSIPALETIQNEDIIFKSDIGVSAEGIVPPGLKATYSRVNPELDLNFN